MGDRNIAERVNLLVESLQRKIYDTRNPKKKKQTEVQAFIIVWKAKYLQLTDFQYTARINNIEIKSIKHVIERVKQLYFTVDEYLDWFFDDFLQKKPKFCPPNIKLICSEFVVMEFQYRFAGDIKRRKEQALVETAEGDILNKARALFRKTKNKLIRVWLKEYDSGTIGLVELKEKLDKAEESLEGKNE
jgi:hypothetical protein